MAKKLARAEKGKGQGQKAAARGRKNVMVAGIIIAAVAAVVGVGYLAMSASGPQRGPDGLVARGAEAPGFSMNRLGAGGAVSLADHKGKVVVLNFWHSQ